MRKREVEDIAIERAEYFAEEYAELAGAIVRLACSDYADAINEREKYKGSETPGAMRHLFHAKNMMEDCERFFRSGWFEQLTDGAIDGESLRRSVARQTYERIRDPIARKAANGA